MAEADFLQKDYELKTKYLSDHLQRMWTRFNFFVTIESALISGKFLIALYPSDKVSYKLYKLLVAGKIAPISKGQISQMAVVAQGNNFDLYIDGSYVGSAHDSDTTLASGILGLVAGNDLLDNPIADIAYTNVQVWVLK